MLVRQITDKKFGADREIFYRDTAMIPALYLVRTGKVKLTKKNGKEQVISPGGYFGHEYLVVTSKGSRDAVPKQVKAKYTATTIGPVVCGMLTLQECSAVFGHPAVTATLDSIFIELEDLTRHRIMGEGLFGTVWLVTNKKAKVQEPYALKIQSTDNCDRPGAVECIKHEIKMMRELQYLFTVEVINTYEDKHTISMLIGLAPGGELFDIIHQQNEQGQWVSGIGEVPGRFYAAVVADTLAFMHQRKYVYRDLKPENVLIDKSGYPILADFGFGKF
jgi:hypothetical protein